MKCHSLCFGENNENITNFVSAELARSAVKLWGIKTLSGETIDCLQFLVTKYMFL